jgi:hypothetical protein
VQEHRNAALVMLVLVGAGAGCRHAPTPAAPLPQDWRSLAQPPAGFAALYRFSCCGQRNLVLAVRSGGDRLSISVAVPPGGTSMSVWFAGDEGWVQRVKERCREPLPKGMIPLSKDAALPLDPGLAARLLSGLLPEDAHEEPMTPGWVEASNERFTWRARIEGPPARCTRILVFRHGEERPMLEAGSQRAEMVLQEWHSADPPQPPGWLALPDCGAAR